MDYNEDFEERDNLPFKKNPKQKLSLWKVIKDSIGKDLTKITIPVEFNEPLSMVQKTSEIMEYENLLVKANNENDSVLRYLYVIAFNIA